MKKIFNILALCGLVALTSSCKKYLDVNENPNNLTTATPDLILPQALVATAANSVTFNTYGSWVAGVQANAGGYGGFGSVLTYNYSTTDNNGLWNNSFDNINDYQIILNTSTPTGPYKYYNAAARIMKAFAYERLINQYGDVPYTEASKGLANLTPKYDKAEDIYKDLFVQINAAIAVMNSAEEATTISLISGTNGSIDVMFGNGLDNTAANRLLERNRWIQFANTLKLRMLIRLQRNNSVVPSMAATYTAERTAVSTASFITDDVIVQPKYEAQAGKQNPMYNAFAFTATGTNADLTRIPTFYAVGFYSGNKISDPGRAAVVYRGGASSLTTYAGQLGITTNPNSVGGSPWYNSFGATSGSTASRTTNGILKGPAMGQPIMLLAEAKFLLAEANLIGLVTGSAQTNYEDGVRASFRYLYKDQNNGFSVVNGTKAYTEAAALADANTYLTSPNNNTNRLVVWTLATDDAQRLEAIITQKWIALQQIHSDEIWNEYRRTGYPVTNPGGTAYQRASSTQSVSTAADKLPVRQKYPSSEYAVNAGNVPTDKNVYTDKIFWDVN